MKNRCLILFLALLFLLIGTVSAADVSEDTISTSDSNQQIMHDVQSNIINDNDVKDNLQTEKIDNTTKIEEDKSNIDIKQAQTDDNITSEIDDITDVSENESTPPVENTTINNPVTNKDVKLTSDNNDTNSSDSGLFQQIQDALVGIDVDGWINSLNQTINDITQNINVTNWLDSLNQTLNNLTDDINSGNWLNSLNDRLTNLTESLNTSNWIDQLNNLTNQINSGDYLSAINDTINNLTEQLNISDLISSLNDTLNNITNNINSGEYLNLLNESINNLTDKLNTSYLIDLLNDSYNNLSQRVNTTQLLDSLNKTLNDLKDKINSTDLFDSADNLIKDLRQRLDIMNMINSIKDLLNYLNITNQVKITASPTSGIIGEKLILKATVTDIINRNINEGKVIFKINGVTVKDNGKLTGSSKALKVNVVNGVATATINLDLDMKSASKYIASYLGTNNYNPSVSSEAKIQVYKRNATIEVSSNKKTIKQGQVLTLTAKVYDTTNSKKSTNMTKYDDEYVFFKINGITLKDTNGQVLKAKIKNGVAKVNYTVPLGLSGVTDTKSMTVKNHTILAQFYNKNYQDNIHNTSTFQVERSNITMTITNVNINNKTHKLSLKTTIKDYQGNIVLGSNKCIIKINGITLKNDTKPMYYYSTNGILTIKNIDIPSFNKYTNIEVVTQDRLSYKNQRNTTTVIKVLN
ncbi:MAG: Ig-like domain repeat protein [Methanosphaera stadtmanae]|nr:Ig-like domain repeat protein [Methanosphaera stadtmanae]